MPADEWQRVLAVNVAGVTNGLRTFVPGMLAAGDDRFVLITGSLAGVVTFATGGAYPASKHAVVALAEQAALSLSGTKVSVTLLCPALVRTGMSPEGADPLVVAERALDAVEQRRFAVIDDDWHGAVARRAATLISGGQPHSPVPGSLS